LRRQRTFPGPSSRSKAPSSSPLHSLGRVEVPNRLSLFSASSRPQARGSSAIAKRGREPLARDLVYSLF
jgi:hypothetical protein